MRILLATDGSETARTALALLLDFPVPEEREVIVLTVVDEEVFGVESGEVLASEQRESLRSTEQLLRDEHNQLLEEELARLRSAGLNGRGQIRSGDPAEQILQAAKEFDVDLVVVGSHGLRGIKRFLLGSVSQHVLSYATCSVLIVKAPRADARDQAFTRQSQRVERVLLAYDGSSMARRAAGFCASFPFAREMELKILTVLPLVTCYRQDIPQRTSWIWQAKKRSAMRALEELADEFDWPACRVSIQLRESPDVCQEILDQASEYETDLIILGHKGKSAIKALMLGSVTSRIAQHAACSILAVR